ncbi:hypothetical protein [Brevundimonas sp.]|uniref:hypothetical protein n=1 Tax=Brevundimonas sp. TaxID=1871086 RepID=UPI003D146646
MAWPRYTSSQNLEKPSWSKIVTIKSGFYGIRQSGADQDPLDDEAWGLAMLTYVGNGKMVGVDQGGCRISGTYVEGDDAVTIQMAYELKCGSHLPDGSILQNDHTLVRELVLGVEAFNGGYQLTDAGLGPMFLKLQWLAEGL